LCVLLEEVSLKTLRLLTDLYERKGKNQVIAFFIRGSVEVFPLTFNLNVRLILLPRVTCFLLVSFLFFYQAKGHIMNPAYMVEWQMDNPLSEIISTRSL